MELRLTPGNSLTCKVNNHRERWSGVICDNAENWNCGADAQFREDFCARGNDRCFHVHAFDPADPYIIIERNGGDWLLGEAPDALDDQLLFFWGLRATTERGISERDHRSVLFGAYRVRGSEQVQWGSRLNWLVRPHAEGWVCFSHLNLPRPRFEDIGGNYIKQFDAFDVRRVLEGVEGHPEGTASGDISRFDKFVEGYPRWIEQAKEKAKDLVRRFPSRSQEPLASGTLRSSSRSEWNALPSGTPSPPVHGSKALAGLGKVIDASRVSVRTDDAPTHAEAKTHSPPAGAGFDSIEVRDLAGAAGGVGTPIEGAAATWIEATYGVAKLEELQVAFATRELVVLGGDPGVGKSHLALRLLDDPERSRTLVVPVSATWRGREDLLGYINPIDGSFQSTPFTEFLVEAAKAWPADPRPRVVVFEEFNLSQPEHWLGDVLATSQYTEECDRRIALGGASASELADVFLSPAIRFVATVNHDHTTRSLSPRVLDRAAFVRLELTAKEALRRIGLQLEDNSVAAIADLDFLLRPRGASFSIRTARALARCKGLPGFESTTRTLDVVLSQQVLSKVRLMAHEPEDLGLRRELTGWCERHGDDLPRCTALIASWKEQLEAGADVVQA